MLKYVMKIINIESQILSTPLKTPFKTSLRTVTHLQDLVVTIQTDQGLIGYGEGAATAVITGETLKGMQAALAHITPLLINQELTAFNHLLHTLEHSMVHNTTLKSALEIALYDLWAQYHQQPLYRLLGGNKTTFSTDITISLNAIDEMLQDAQKAVDLGYDTLKIKVGTTIAEDYQRIQAISQTFPDTKLRIDANQAWSPKESVRILNRLEREGINIDLIEQPVKANDLRGMRYIKERTLTPLLADESIFSPKQTIELLEMDACDLVNIKLAKCGGISNALKIADIASLYNVECMMGCMLEGPISIGAALHVVSARSESITRLDLDGVALLDYNPIQGGALFQEHHLRLHDGLGLGIEGIAV